MFVVHLHDLDVVVGAEQARDLFHQREHQVNDDAHVRGVDDGRGLGHLVQHCLVCRRKAGGADNMGRTVLGRLAGVDDGGGGDRELHHRITGLEYRTGIVTDGNAQLANARQFAGVMTEKGALLLLAGGGERRPFGLGNRLCQHAAHAAACADNA